MSVANETIVNDGQLLFAKGFGVSDVESNRRPLQIRCIVSKSLTATAAMWRVEELTLDLAAMV